MGFAPTAKNWESGERAPQPKFFDAGPGCIARAGFRLTRSFMSHLCDAHGNVRLFSEDFATFDFALCRTLSWKFQIKVFIGFVDVAIFWQEDPIRQSADIRSTTMRKVPGIPSSVRTLASWTR